MLFWNAGIMGRKEQLLEAIFGSMRSRKGGDCHVATSPRRDVTKSRRRVNKCRSQQFSHVATSPRRHVATSPRRHVATSPRQLENLHLIIKCQRARKGGHREAYDQRHGFQELEDPDFESFPGIRTVFRFC